MGTSLGKKSATKALSSALQVAAVLSAPPALLAASGQLLQGGPFMSTQVCKGDETLPSHDLHVGGGEARHFPN